MIGIDVILGADSESPRMTLGKSSPEELKMKNCFLGGHVTSARLNGKRLHFSVGLGFNLTRDRVRVGV